MLWRVCPARLQRWRCCTRRTRFQGDAPQDSDFAFERLPVQSFSLGVALLREEDITKVRDGELRLLVIRAEYTETTGKRLPLQDLCFTQLALAHQRIREVAHREQNARVIVALDAAADLEPLPLQALGFRDICRV